LITAEFDAAPEGRHFDIAFVALGYEPRCRWVWSTAEATATHKIALEFGFLQQGAYAENRDYMKEREFSFLVGIGPTAVEDIISSVSKLDLPESGPVTVLLDISAMSREMIANVLLGLNHALCGRAVVVSSAYAPSKFDGGPSFAPISRSQPITRALSGWSSRPEQPLGLIVGLGCEKGLALGALQFLEPDKAWLFVPIGIDASFDASLLEANEGIEDIFDATRFGYDIAQPSMLRAKFEALLNSVNGDYRTICIPFGPKMFAWACLSTLIFKQRHEIGVWAFSSLEQGHATSRQAEGPIIWHTLHVAAREHCPI
jgi:hypothetical protein